VLSNPNFNVCMTGPRNASELTEALKALDDGPLSDEEMTRIRAIGRHVSGK
jgi:aryl-alcohol dehydrogenase-like predicted oxidoreductase